MNLKVKIIGDGNCLFRCFSYFLYNNQNFHMKIRLNLSSYIKNNWEQFKNFVIGNCYYKNITNGNEYYEFMSKNGIYGNELEITAFVNMYNIKIMVHLQNSNHVFEFDNNLNSNNILILYLSGIKDAGHYDIIDFSKDNIKDTLTSIKNKKYYLKRKRNDDLIINSGNKKPKLNSTNINIKNDKQNKNDDLNKMKTNKERKIKKFH